MSSVWITPEKPALVLAPMEGVTDAPMRQFLTKRGGFRFCVSEFFRISHTVPYPNTFHKHIPELKQGALTSSGIPVQVQLLGGDPEILAKSALNALYAGATAIDLNFGCPAPCVNRHDGGASLLKFPKRITGIVKALREALPPAIPVSAKLRLGWENPEDIFENALAAEKGGAQWITIHARTKMQGYKPPAYWKYIGEVRKNLSIPVVANGDIWSMDDFLRCQEITGCSHFMIGRSALANPALPLEISSYLNTGKRIDFPFPHTPENWKPLLKEFSFFCKPVTGNSNYAASRIKQWLSMASLRLNQKDSIEWISSVKRAGSLNEIFSILENHS